MLPCCLADAYAPPMLFKAQEEKDVTIREVVPPAPIILLGDPSRLFLCLRADASRSDGMSVVALNLVRQGRKKFPRQPHIIVFNDRSCFKPATRKEGLSSYTNV